MMTGISEIPIDGYGDETDANGRYIGLRQLSEPPTGQMWIDRRDMTPKEEGRQIRAWHVGAMDHSEPVSPHEMTIDVRQFLRHPDLYSHWQPVSRAPVSKNSPIKGDRRSRTAITSGTPEPTPNDDAKYLDHGMKSEKNLSWVRTGPDVAAGGTVVKVRNYEAKNSTNIEIALAMAIANFLNGDDDVMKLRQENQRLREALTTIADTIAAAADYE